MDENQVAEGEQQQEQEQQPDPAIETKAREQGWVPKEKWKGDPALWKPAADYVAIGETLVPFLKRDRERLSQELNLSKQEVAALKASVKEAQEAIEALKEFNTEAQKTAVKQAMRELREQRAAYQEEGNWKAAAAVDTQLEELREKVDAPAPAPKPKTEAPAPSTPTPDPEFVKWQSDNASWLADDDKRAFANGIASYIRQQNPHLGMRAFLDKVTERVEKEFGGPPPTPKSDGAGLAPSRGAKDRSYASLPADAKKACDDQAKRLVGPGKAFKDEAAWRKHYVSLYDWE